MYTLASILKRLWEIKKTNHAFISFGYYNENNDRLLQFITTKYILKRYLPSPQSIVTLTITTEVTAWLSGQHIPPP